MPFDATAWNDTEARNDDAPPDNDYEVELADSTIITANADGRQSVKLTWRVLAGAERDRQWSSIHSIERYNKNGDPTEALRITKEMLAGMGIDTDVADERELRDAMARVHGWAYVVRVKRNGTFTNTTLRQVLREAQPSFPGSGGGDKPAAAPASAITGEDVPTRSPRDEFGF